MLTAALGAPAQAAAPKSLEAEVATLRTRAANQAKAGKWELAIHTLSTARERVQHARRLALRKAGPAPSDPKRHQAMKELQTWYVGQMKRVASGKTDRQHVIREFQSRQEALLRKYPQKPVSPTTPAASTAKLDLLLAKLDDARAQYNAHRGKPRAAASQRQNALIGRLHALKAQGQTAPAALVAEKLLKEAPRDPDAVSEVAQFYQERKQFTRAAQVWEGGIRTLESGQADLRRVGPRQDRSQVGKRYLGEFYRQVAFCYSQLKRGADAKAAMEKATRAEATLVRGGAQR
jgi:hypothetical protein